MENVNVGYRDNERKCVNAHNMKRCELVLFHGAIKMIEIATNVLLIRVRTPLLDAVLQSKSAIHSTLIHY